ncbi:Myo-inositol 2-dehydrogenase [Klebsiella pneumoniae]|nr:Gfo/Idh/MocA family oxidoreductase [Klebsiella pneumoniae]NOM94456.1 Gfo/Idh/MocA family oxidoreductase [Klebsiella pneumoniae]NOM99212.1 Gfo/Idh/MocA family oxidoreductase [Klebsiella pneumoniae]NON71506.1 Gfo/Idh/MocA family oxidoreductase [Klebsiella pneumoniae]SVV79212.1 Myo-inositol 2-dehydrogenase [Klebsiella pneumoniae]
MSARLNIGLIGSGFMGQAHADAYRRAAMFYPDLPKRPHLYALADQDQAMAERHAAKLGAEKAYGDWRELVNDPQVDVVDITSPNHLHYTMAMAAIAAGKHVYCEKPLAVNEQQAQEIVARGSATAEGLNGQTSMLFSWQNGMQGLLNTTLFSNTPGGAVVAGRQATLTIDGQFYAPGGFTLAASQGGQVLRWEEPRNRYDQLFWQAEHFAWCIGQGVQDSPLRPLSRVLQNLQVMDEVRRQVGAVFNEER